MSTKTLVLDQPLNHHLPAFGRSVALEVLSEHIRERGARYSFENAELDQLVAGGFPLERFGSENIEAFLFDDLKWWEVVVMEIMVDSDKGDEFGGSPEKVSRRERLLQLLGDVLTAYPATLRERQAFGAGGEAFDEAPASNELLKRYRLYTRGVCEAAKEVWPSVNLQALFDQP